MKTTAKFINIDNLDVELTITMSVRDWRSLKGQLMDSHPSWKLSSQISEVISKLETIAYKREE